MYSYEYANATSGWMKNGYFLDYMGNSRLRKEGYAQWSQFT